MVHDADIKDIVLVLHQRQCAYLKRRGVQTLKQLHDVVIMSKHGTRITSRTLYTFHHSLILHKAVQAITEAQTALFRRNLIDYTHYI